MVEKPLNSAEGFFETKANSNHPKMFLNSSTVEKKSSSRDSSFHFLFRQQLMPVKQNFN